MKDAGIIIFAQNNSHIDYVNLAVFAARRVQQYLDLPVSLITDSPDWLEKTHPDHPFDRVIQIEPTPNAQTKPFNDGSLSSKHLEWKNYTRNRAYELTPYYKTLVIDSDYIICSDTLKSAFLVDAEFQIYSSSMDLAEWRSTDEFTRINRYSIPFYWATTFLFEKTPLVERFFDLISYIKLNWDYYRSLYNIDVKLYRNDFAFSIALHILNGKSSSQFSTELPGKLVYTKDKDILVSIDDQKITFLLEKKDYNGEYILSKTSSLDVHVMNKFSLSRFINGGSGV